MASIDVIVPSYNYARYLPDCISSILAQPVNDLRIVVIDNASTDDSLAVAQELASKDDRIEIVAREKNLGPHASFNEGIDRARADYFLILCADDVLASNSLGLAIETLEAHPEAVFAFGPEMNMQECERYGPSAGSARWSISSGDRFIGRCCQTLGVGIGFGSVVVRTSAQKKVGHYDASLAYTDDLDMLLRLAQLGSVAECNSPIGIRREHDANMTKTYLRKRVTDLKEREITFDRYFECKSALVTGVQRKHALVRRRIAEAAYWSAASSLLRGNRSDAVDLYKYGLQLKPSSMLLPPLGHLVRKPGVLKRTGAVLSEVLLPRRKALR